MARIRTIKPEFFRHEGLQDLEQKNPGKHCMLVFAGLWGHCDRDGRFEWRPRMLKLDILPFLKFDMTDTLEILRTAGLVRQYAAGGKDYGLITSFPEHQRITGKESESGGKYPEPPQETPGKHPGNTGELPDAQEGKGREGNRKGTDTPRKRGRHTLPPDFQISEEIRAWCLKNSHDHPEASLDYLRDWATANAKQYADWDATLRNCIKADWGKARELARKKSGANGFAGLAFAEFRQALRDGKRPAAWAYPQTEAALKAIGGWDAARYAQSRDLDFKQKQFEAAFYGAAA